MHRHLRTVICDGGNADAQPGCSQICSPPAFDAQTGRCADLYGGGWALKADPAINAQPPPSLARASDQHPGVSEQP